MILKASFIVNFIFDAVARLCKFGKHYEEKATIGRLFFHAITITTPPTSLHSETRVRVVNYANSGCKIYPVTTPCAH
jgi:hypothetical protein